MVPTAIAAITFISTFAGGLFALRHKDHLHRILGFAAGVVLGVVIFDLVPEIFELIETLQISTTGPMIALLVGFLAFHVIEKSILLHHSQEAEYGDHKHPHVGMASALALIGHSFLDGMAIGFAFQVNSAVGIAVAIAVIAHDFTDGLNTVSLMLLHKNSSKKAVLFLLFDAIAPVLGALATLVFQIPDSGLVIYLGFFAGFLLYIGASEILPEAHSKHSSYGTIALTIAGAALMFLVTRFIEG